MSCDSEIEKLKMKRTLDSIDSSEGFGTSMITLFIHAGGSVDRTKKKIADELSAATQIKSRV